MIHVHKIPNTPIASNCFVVYGKEVGRDCIIVDPGSDNNRSLYAFIDCERLLPRFIILTHEHFDHCWGADRLREKYPQTKLICSTSCSMAIQQRKTNYSVFFSQPGFDLRPADVTTEDLGWSLLWHSKKILFYKAQGHSFSGVLFRVGNWLFTGDELIKDVITVTKLKTSSKGKLKDSLELLNSMKGMGITICPGHGELFPLDDYDLNQAQCNEK